MSVAPRPWQRRLQRLALLCLLAAALLATFFAGILAGVFRYPLAHSAYKMLTVNLGLLDDSRESHGRNVRAQQSNWGSPTPAAAPIDSPMDCAPWPEIARNALAKRFHLPRLLCPAAHVAAADAAASRLEFMVGEELADRIVVKGEIGTFLDQCPAPWGCLAVEYSRSGLARHAWPFRPEKIEAADIASESDYPYHQPVGWSFSNDLDTFHISPFPDGDLAVVFRFHSSQPDGGGVARVAPDGRPRWYRKDYSHGQPHVLNEDSVLVPGVRLHRFHLSYSVAAGSHRNMELRCRNDMIREDRVNIVGRHGDILEEIAILDAIFQSRHASYLIGAPSCDPTHLNFAHVLGADARGAAGMAAGDLVVSLRNLSAFAILDKNDRHLKRLVHGSFHRQHGVRHLSGSRFVLFDNFGADAVAGPARLLTVDLATGRETTVFPNDKTPEHLLDWFALLDGTVDVSTDRSRVLLADPLGARAVEIRLADGQVLNVFRQLHDLSALPGVPEDLVNNAALFEFRGVHYANRWEAMNATPRP